MAEYYLSRQDTILTETIKYLTIDYNKIEIRKIITTAQRIILFNISTVSNLMIKSVFKRNNVRLCSKITL